MSRAERDATVTPVPKIQLSSFDLVVASVGRVSELEQLLASLDAQTHRAFRVLLVDQNDDDRLGPTLEQTRSFPITRLRATRGLSHARNEALPHLTSDVVAFPDDDCSYPDDLLERVARRLVERPDLDGVTGRAADPTGATSDRWPSAASLLTPNTLWNSANSHTLFLRRPTVEGAGRFDESLGLGSGTPWHSGEEIELLVRALRNGARVEYDPSLVVHHSLRRPTTSELRALGARDGASVGYILRKHRYPARAVARMLVRPLGGIASALTHRDVAAARFHLATLRGRIAGYRAGAPR